MVARTKSSAAGDEQTPMMQQYFRAKEQHPGEILFFRMGDFYEMFYDDAKTVSELLGIALTARGKDKSGQRVPMAGIPVKSVDTYIRRLLEAGQRVAICEQLQDASEVKGIVDRGVVRVVTPGTFVDDEHLDDDRALHLAAFVEGPPPDSGVRTVGLAWVDLSTGKFFAEDLPETAVNDALVRIGPAECLHLDGLRAGDSAVLTYLSETQPRCARTPYPEWHFEREAARERLLAHFGTQSLQGFGCEHLGPGVAAAGALVRYLEETQRQALPHIARLNPGLSRRHLVLDTATHRALELLEVNRTGERRGSLLGLLQRTRTAMGARLVREWLCAPLTDREAILDRQSAVSGFVDDDDLRDGLGKLLADVRDVERLVSRLPMGRVNGRDLRALEKSLSVLPELREGISGSENRVLAEVHRRLEPEVLAQLAQSIGEAIVDEPPMTIKEGGVIRDGFDPQLDELRSIGRDAVDWIAQFQADEAERTGIPNLKIGYNRVFGYYLEITHAHQGKVPDDYQRKQTLKNAERYINPSLKEQENKVLGAKERAEKLELELFQRLRLEIQEHLVTLQVAAEGLAELDAVIALARVAQENGYVRPEIVDEPLLDIREGRHPVLAAGLGLEDFTPNDTVLGADDPRFAIITGPNMAGKSTYIRQTALITILAQMGSWVPAASARVGICDRIFTRVGAADDLTRGQSTFMVEMTETANILNNAGPRSLVILDEVGRGTSTTDGVSLAWAITEHLIRHNQSLGLFATHYHELTELAERFPEAVANLNVAVREWQDQIVFLHQILPGGTDKAYGIHVARLAGIPGEALERAKDILAHLEGEHARSHTAPPVREPVQQLDLFGNAYDDLDRRLRKVDIDGTTPLEALNLLSELRKLLP